MNAVEEWVADLRSLAAWHQLQCASGPACRMHEKYMEAINGLERLARHPVIMSSVPWEPARDTAGRTPLAREVMRAAIETRPSSVICERCEACIALPATRCWDCGAPVGVG